MLQTFRDFGNKKIVQILLALFLIIPFGFFGMDRYFNGGEGGDVVASVGHQRIGEQEFNDAIRRQADVYRQQFRGQFDPSLMDNPEIRRAVLDRLVADRLVTTATDRSGVRFTDAELSKRILAEPAFQVDGKFSKERYDVVAKSQGLSPAGLDERLRRDLSEQQFRDSIVNTTFVPKATLDGFIRLSQQTREVSVVNFTPDQYMAKAAVKPEELKAYYDAHPKEFTIPERVRVEYVELSLDALAAKQPVNPEDVKKLYEEQALAGKLGVKEERRASHILISVPADAKDDVRKAAEEKADAIAARVRKNPASFADVAKKESQDPGSAVQGGDLGFFARGAMVKPFEEAVFDPKVKKGEIVGPVKSDFGYHVIRLTDVKGGSVKPLAEATPQIEATLKKQAAQKTFTDAAEQFSNLVYEQSTSLKPVADKLGLTIQQSPWIQKGAPTIPALNNPKIQNEIFSDATLKGKRNTAAIETATNTLVAARLLESKPEELRTFDAVKGEIEAKLKREAAVKLANEEGAARLKELQAGKDAGLKWPAPLAVNRQKAGGLFPEVIEKVFRADPKKLPAYVGVETPVGYSVVKVSKVVDIDKVDDKQRDALSAQLRNAVAAEELDSVLGSLRERVGVTVRKDVLEKKPPQ
ncbi:MAG TPA: SurA N-terminal domain-containing protein [Usitatibacter sp.]|jgi:peptidyl-prolyl cis-trans isomerase D|nr:SurA N-terminal domain-containing protein [Usitatibacter sp.]